MEPGSADFSGEGAGSKATRLLGRIFRFFSDSLLIPADASGVYRPNPEVTSKLAAGHP